MMRPLLDFSVINAAALPFTSQTASQDGQCVRQRRARGDRVRSQAASGAAMTAPVRIVVTETGIIGQLLSRGLAGTEAFDIDDRSLGLFATADEAAAALLKVAAP
jgi:hypothetical protein